MKEHLKNVKIPYCCPCTTKDKSVEHPHAVKRYVACYRVFTPRRGNRGLGLSARRTGGNAYLDHKGQLIGEFTHIVSGKKDNRPQLGGGSTLVRNVPAATSKR